MLIEQAAESFLFGAAFDRTPRRCIANCASCSARLLPKAPPSCARRSIRSPLLPRRCAALIPRELEASFRAFGGPLRLLAVLAVAGTAALVRRLDRLVALERSAGDRLS